MEMQFKNVNKDETKYIERINQIYKSIVPIGNPNKKMLNIILINKLYN